MTDLVPGVYEHLVTADLHRRLGLVDDGLLDRRPLDPDDADEVLVRYLAGLTRRALKIAREGTDKAETRDVLIKTANHIAKGIASAVADSVLADDLIHERGDLLMAIAAGLSPDGASTFPQRPDIPLSTSALLVNGRDQPQIGAEVRKELASADKVDLLCAFIKWHGLVLIDEQLKKFLDRGGKLRVITTTYIGATERRALDRLKELGAEIKISYETRTTRLHAKAWLFHRGSRLDTAYVGSSNLSRTAMLDGKEWNVRLARAEQPHLIDTFAATFEEYWADPSFEEYLPDRDGERLDRALAQEHGAPTDLPLQITNIDVHPYPYQREILEELEAVRSVHDQWRNLVVMATGTGKTIVAALDYKQLCELGQFNSLLFVAHRMEILEQSRATFRQVMKDGSFGELLVNGKRPKDWTHVFASVQSLNSGSITIEPDRFDVVIVDEFHHAEAATYARLLDHLTPKVLLGLTATPERTDGADILHWFDGNRPTVELRLWEALERDLLVPFHYFGIHDDTDLSGVAWRRGAGYDPRELTELYTGHHSRAAMVVEALQNKLSDVGRMRAVGFCVSIQHAVFMAEQFNNKGIPAVAVTSETPAALRADALIALRKREVNAVFTVDLFNEGIDVPQIDTVLFLRPTDSPTIFLQQLGRGLRFADDKPCLTVLDFVGRQNMKFRFDRRYRALTGISRRRLEHAVEEGFPTLPAGCHIDLDRDVTALVLENIRQALGSDKRTMIAELRSMPDPTLSEFLTDTGIELEDLYRGTRGGWTSLRREAGFETRPVKDPKDDKSVAGAIGRMLHIDDPERLGFLRDLLTSEHPPRWGTTDPRRKRLLAMLHAAIDSTQPLSQLEQNLNRLWINAGRREELLAITGVLFDQIRRMTPVVFKANHIPLHLHATYSKAEALAAFGMEKPASMREGVIWMPQEKSDLFFVTINKTEAHFSPQTMYNDRAISPTEFQWESQGRASASTETGQRYMHHAAQGSSVHLFIRESKENAPPYLYAGPMTYLSYEGDRPMRILWRLDHALPADVFHYAKVTAG